jgi:hypothetical protein
LHHKTVTGAILGFDLVAVLQLLTLSALDKRLLVALYCFVISIPLLALHLRILLLHANAEYRLRTWYDPLTTIISLPLSVAGVAAIFFHFSITAGCVFSGLAIFGLLASHHYRVRVRQANEF